MNMKKVVSGILSGVLALSMAAGLSGCGGGKEDKLIWYMFGDAPADHKMVMEKANEIIEPEIGLKLDIQYIDSASYEEKMKLKMASGEAYDLAFTGWMNRYQDCVRLGGLYDITSLLDEVGMKEVIPQFFLDSATIDGKIYGIPNIQVVSNPITFMIDKPLADKAGIDMAAIQEAGVNLGQTNDLDGYAALLDDAFAKIKAAKPEAYTLSCDCDIFVSPAYEEIAEAIVIKNDGSSTKIERQIDIPNYKYGITKMNEWYNKGYIKNDIATGSMTDEEAKTKSGMITGTWKPGQDPSVMERYNWSEPAYAFIQKPYVKRDSTLATMTSVGANSKHPKEAVELLKLINFDKELFNILVMGIEGTHYNLNEEGKVVTVENSGYDIGKNAWAYGNQFNALVMEGQETGVWEETEEMNNTAMISPMLGFVPELNSVSAEVANISSVQAEFYAKTNYGTEDPANWWDDYVAKLEQAGIDKVVAELQKQYDEFLANKN